MAHDEITLRSRTEHLAAFDVRLPPGGGPPMLHRHDACELYRVERGRLAVYVEDDDAAIVRRVLAAGEVVVIPGGREHTIRNESGDDARALAVFAPGAEMERFAAAARGEADMDRILDIASAHGIEITRPLTEVA